MNVIPNQPAIMMEVQQNIVSSDFGVFSNTELGGIIRVRAVFLSNSTCGAPLLFYWQVCMNV